MNIQSIPDLALGEREHVQRILFLLTTNIKGEKKIFKRVVPCGRTKMKSNYFSERRERERCKFKEPIQGLLIQATALTLYLVSQEVKDNDK